MDIDTATLFFALLALMAQLAVIGFVVLSIGARFSPAVGRARQLVVDAVAPQAAGFGLLVALTSTLGSLYLSEIANLPPCRLCWVQRGFMYPQVILFAIVLITRTRHLWWPIIVTVALGGSVSIYHVALERFPDLEAQGTCELHNPCSTILVEHLGYITIPAMALSGFALLLTLAMIGRTAAHRTENHEFQSTP